MAHRLLSWDQVRIELSRGKISGGSALNPNMVSSLSNATDAKNISVWPGLLSNSSQGSGLSIPLPGSSHEVLTARSGLT
jgi:hypothetical protein